MGRFNDIMRAPVLQTQFTRYMDWLNDTPAARQSAYQAVRNPAGRAKHTRVPGYIRPFNNPRAGLRLETRVLGQTQTSGGDNGPVGDDRSATAALQMTLGTPDLVDYTLGATPGIVLPVPKYQFARLIVTNRVSTAPDRTLPSRMTGRVYGRHRTLAASQPFGRGEATILNYSEAVNEIKSRAAYTQWIANVGDTVSFVPERGVVN